MDLISDQLKAVLASEIERIEEKEKITQDNAEFLVVVPSAIFEIENGYPPIFLRKNEKKCLKVFLTKYLVLHPEDKNAEELKTNIEI